MRSERGRIPASACGGCMGDVPRLAARETALALLRFADLGINDVQVTDDDAQRAQASTQVRREPPKGNYATAGETEACSPCKRKIINILERPGQDDDVWLEREVEAKGLVDLFHDVCRDPSN